MALLQQQINSLDFHLRSIRCYIDPGRLRADCLGLLHGTPSLQPASVRTASPQPVLVFLVGTLPIQFRMNQYNIPIQIWFGDNYPMMPPTVFVTPTNDMVIKTRHRHVDSQGMVYHPYISSWNPGGSNLIHLAAQLALAFGEDPPVRQKKPETGPPAATPNLQHSAFSSSSFGAQPQPSAAFSSSSFGGQPQSNYQPPPHYPYGAGSGPSSSGPASGGYPNQYYPQTQPPPQYPTHQQYQSQYPPQQAHQGPDPAIAKRAELSSKLQAELDKFNKATQAEIEHLMNSSQNTAAQRNAIDREKGQLAREKSQLLAQLQDTDRRIRETTVWLEQNDIAQSNTSIDDMTDPTDPLSKQLLENVAQDATVEDLIYYLDRALMKSTIDLDQYLKEIRRLAREQFYYRATIKKIHLVQSERR